jgi:hypothetical protein
MVGKGIRRHQIRAQTPCKLFALSPLVQFGGRGSKTYRIDKLRYFRVIR